MRTSKTENEKRVLAVFKMLLAGAKRADIVQYASSSRGWRVVPRTADGYIRKARDRFLEASKVDREEEYGKARERLEDLYAMNLKAGDLRAAHAVLSDTAELLGLYPAKVSKQEHTGAGGGPIQLERVMDDVELSERLRLALVPGGEGIPLPPPDEAATGGN